MTLRDLEDDHTVRPINPYPNHKESSMTNEVKDKTKNTATDATQVEELDSWTMATSILTGIRKAIAKAEEERLEAAKATLDTNNPFGRGVRKYLTIRDALCYADKPAVRRESSNLA